METILSILTVFLIAWGIGFVNAMMSNWLDSALDYGKIFGDIRFKIVERYAIKADKSQTFKELTDAVKLKPSFSDRLNDMNTVYWQIAKFEKGVQRFICKTCMATNLLLLSFIPYGYILLDFDFHRSLLFIFMLSFSFNEYYINK